MERRVPAERAKKSPGGRNALLCAAVLHDKRPTEDFGEGDAEAPDALAIRGSDPELGSRVRRKRVGGEIALLDADAIAIGILKIDRHGDAADFSRSDVLDLADKSDGGLGGGLTGLQEFHLRAVHRGSGRG